MEKRPDGRLTVNNFLSNSLPRSENLTVWPRVTQARNRLSQFGSFDQSLKTLLSPGRILG